MHGRCVGVRREPPAGTPFVCTACMRAAAMGRVTAPCGSTLVVCPAAILSQWWVARRKGAGSRIRGGRRAWRV